MIINQTFNQSKSIIPFIHHIYHLGDVEMLELLLKYGADINAVDKDGNSILHYDSNNPLSDGIHSMSKLEQNSK